MARLHDIMAATELLTDSTIDNYAIIGRIEATETEARELLALANEHARVDDLNRRRYWAMLARLAGVTPLVAQPQQAAAGTIGTPEQFEADMDTEHGWWEHSDAVLAALRARYGDDAEELWSGHVALLEIADRSSRWVNTAAELLLLKAEADR